MSPAFQPISASKSAAFSMRAPHEPMMHLTPVSLKFTLGFSALFWRAEFWVRCLLSILDLLPFCLWPHYWPLLRWFPLQMILNHGARNYSTAAANFSA